MIANTAYGMVKLGEQDEYDHMHEALNMPSETSTSFVKTEDETYSVPRSHQPLPAIPLPVVPPTGGDVGVVKNRKEESV